MSKANSSNINPDQEIRARFRDFVQSLTLSTFKQVDERTGYSKPVQRQLTTSEQQRFYNSLPSTLQEYIDSQRSERFSVNEDYEQEPQDEEEMVISDDNATEVPEDWERQQATDLLAYETFLHLDMAQIPYAIQEKITESEVHQLERSPSYRARERMFNKKRKKNQKLPITPILRELAKKRLWRALRQKKQEQNFKQKTFVTVEIVRIVYIDRNP